MAPEVIGSIILLITVVLFITKWIPVTATSMLSIMLFTITGVASFESCVAGFSNFSVVMLFGILIVGRAMLKTGLAQFIGLTAMKWSGGNEKRFLLYIMICMGVLSMFIDNTTCVACFLPIMAAATAESKGNIRFMNLVMPASLAAMIGGGCLLIGCTVNLNAQVVLMGCTDYEFSMFDFTKGCVPALIALVAYVMLVGYKRGMKIWGSEERAAAEKEIVANLGADEDEIGEIDKIQCIKMVGVLVIMVSLFLFSDLSLGVSANIAALLCIVLKLVDIKDAIKHIDWEVVVRLGCALGLAGALKECGFCEMISNAFISAFGTAVSPRLILVVVMIVANIMSQFMGNSTVVLLVGAAIIPVVDGLGINPLSITMALVYGASFAFMTPIAGACIGVSYAAGYEFNDYAKYTFPLTILIYIVGAIWLPIAFPF